MKRKRLMHIEYRMDNDAERLKTNLKMCCVPFVAFREFEFVGGGALWDFYIDRGRLKWNQIMHIINLIKPVPFKYVSNMYIRGGELVEDLGGILPVRAF